MIREQKGSFRQIIYFATKHAAELEPEFMGEEDINLDIILRLRKIDNDEIADA